MYRLAWYVFAIVLLAHTENVFRAESASATVKHVILMVDVLDVIMGAGNPDFDNDGQTLNRVGDCKYVGGPETWKAIEATRASPEGTYRSYRPISTKAEFERLLSGRTPSRVLGTAQVGVTLQQARRRTAGDHSEEDSPLNTGVAQVLLYAVADRPLGPPPAQQLDARPAAFPAAGTKPDILLIMPDQMRGDCLSILDHPTVRLRILTSSPGRERCFGERTPRCRPASRRDTPC